MRQIRCYILSVSTAIPPSQSSTHSSRVLGIPVIRKMFIGILAIFLPLQDVRNSSGGSDCQYVLFKGGYIERKQARERSEVENIGSSCARAESHVCTLQ